MGELLVLCSKLLDKIIRRCLDVDSFLLWDFLQDVGSLDYDLHKISGALPCLIYLTPMVLIKIRVLIF